MTVRFLRIERSQLINLFICSGIYPFATLFFASALYASEPQSALVTYSMTGKSMGTSYHIKVMGDPNGRFEGGQLTTRLKERVDARLDQIDQSFSTYRRDSSLAQFNESLEDSWFEVSPEIIDLVKNAEDIVLDTKGAFDPGIGYAVDLWGFGRDDQKALDVSTSELTATLKNLGGFIGWNNIVWRSHPPAIKRMSAYTRIDFSAIAKGYAVDVIANLLQESGFANGMVEIGGEVVAFGVNQQQKPWQIAIEKPNPQEMIEQLLGQGVHLIVSLNNQAMATSGNYRNYFKNKGVRFSHILDPRTLAPVTHQTASVSVVSSECWRADALATALLVMGREKGLEWANARGIAAYFIEHTESGFVSSFSDSFMSTLQLPRADPSPAMLSRSGLAKNPERGAL